MPVKNYSLRQVGDEGEEKMVKTYRGLAQIKEQLGGLTEKWPRLVNGTLFVAKKPRKGKIPDKEAITMLVRPEQFQAWLKGRVGVSFEGRPMPDAENGHMMSPITVTDLFYHLHESPFIAYDSVEQLPHEPMRKSGFYLDRRIKAEKTGLLEEFANRLNADTEIDRQLLVVMILTMFSGLPAGQRPAFTLMSNYGKGVGKTATGEAILNIAGGAIRIDTNEPPQRINEAFFTESNENKRAVLVDNVRGVLKNTTIESMITAQEIEGHRLHQGRRSRPNLLTWVFTANGPRMSNDLAQRSVIVRIGHRKRGVDFVGWSLKWLDENREGLIADVLHVLKEEPTGRIDGLYRGRFGAWENAVLRKMEGCNQLAARITEMRCIVDADAEDAQALGEMIREVLLKEGGDPDHGKYAIGWATMARICEKAWKVQHMSSRKAATAVRDMMGGEYLPNVGELRTNKWGKGALWTGGEVDLDDQPSIEEFRWLRGDKRKVSGEGDVGEK